MRRYAVPGVITAAVVALLALLAFGVAGSGAKNALASQVRAGHQPPEPDAHTPLEVLGGNGRTETLASLRGKVVMINFFAGWCDACQQEVSIIRAAQRKLEAHGGTVLGVTYQDSNSDARSYLSHYGLTYPALRDPNGTLAQAYGVTGVPETFIINRQGRVEAARTYQLSPSSPWLDDALDRALGLKT